MDEAASAAGRAPATFGPEHARMGIARNVREVFSVGEYRYSKLEDAVAQARRNGL